MPGAPSGPRLARDGAHPGPRSTTSACRRNAPAPRGSRSPRSAVVAPAAGALPIGKAEQRHAHERAPIAPSSISPLIRPHCVETRNSWPMVNACRFCPRRRGARSQSASVIAIGFSSSTCLPASQRGQRHAARAARSAPRPPPPLSALSASTAARSRWTVNVRPLLPRRRRACLAMRDDGGELPRRARIPERAHGGVPRRRSRPAPRCIMRGSGPGMRVTSSVTVMAQSGWRCA